jgi:hypothetical protein
MPENQRGPVPDRGDLRTGRCPRGRPRHDLQARHGNHVHRGGVDRSAATIASARTWPSWNCVSRSRRSSRRSATTTSSTCAESTRPTPEALPRCPPRSPSADRTRAADRAVHVDGGVFSLNVAAPQDIRDRRLEFLPCSEALVDLDQWSQQRHEGELLRGRHRRQGTTSNTSPGDR